MPNYTKTNWVNNSTPAINADNLNKIEAGIKANADSINSFIANSSPLGDNDVVKCVTSNGVNLADQANATAGKTINLSDGSIIDFAGAKLLPLIRIPWEKYNDGKPRAVIISTSTQLDASANTSLRFCTYDNNLNAVYKAGTLLNAEYTTPDGSTRYAQRVYGSNTAPATISNCAYIYVAPENSAFEGTIQVEVQVATVGGEAAIATADGANYEAFNGTNEKVLDSNIIIDSISQVEKEIENTNISVATKDSKYYRGARRPIIAFILDGAYDNNPAMKAKFDTHNEKFGVALLVDATTAAGNIGYGSLSQSTYLQWQDEGVEILTHSNKILNKDNADYPFANDAEAIKWIKDCKRIITTAGFVSNGLIGAYGTISTDFIPTIKNQYNYCASKGNAVATDTPPYLRFNVDDPYGLWRCGMNASTLAEMEAAVDSCIENNGFLWFYGHAHATGDEVGNFTPENLDALLTYIENKGITIKCPGDAIKDYYNLYYYDYKAVEYPEIPAQDKTYVLKCVNGVLTWVEEV